MLVSSLVLGSSPATAATNGIRASGTQFVDGAGTPVKLRGVNRSGAEYSCGLGGTDFRTAFNQADTAQMLSWNINLVRIPLNEHCWLGIEGLDQTTGTAYRQALVDYVNHLNANNIYVVLDLHFTGPYGVGNGDQRNPMANQQYSLPFWSSVASTFKNNHSVMFELFNEPHDLPGDQWSCWLNGCEAWGFQTAGMQDMVDVIRATGATNVIVVNGIDWGHDMRQLLAYMPKDPTGQIAAGQHLYDFKRCIDEACWNREFKPIANVMPMFAPEIGIDACEGGFITRFMKWMDANGGDGYSFWSWSKGSCPAGQAYGGAALFNWDGSASNYGVAVRNYFTGSTTPRPVPTTAATPATSTPTTAAPTTTTTTTTPSGPATSAPTPPPSRDTTNRPAGYRTVASNGRVYGFGDQNIFPGPALPAGVDIVAIVNTYDARGYWLAAADGRVFAYGNAVHQGDLAGMRLNAPIVSMVRVPTGNGYWLLGRDGGVFTFNAPFFGSTGSLTLNAPVVAMEAAVNGDGYWFTASDGGVFAYGPGAPFRGSMGGERLNQPVVGMAGDPGGRGYWLVAADGGVFSFDVPFYGSTGSLVLNAPVIGMAATNGGAGYRFVATDGGVFNFGQSTFYGSTGSAPPSAPIRSLTS